MNINQIKTKKPFRRIAPDLLAGFSIIAINTGESVVAQTPRETYSIVSQSEFLREYYPSGHKIHDPSYYADRIKTDDKGNKYMHFVERVAFDMQQVITTKQLTHLCGNPIEFTNSDTKKGTSQQSILNDFKQLWIKKNMEIAWYEAAKSEKITGDAALVGYFDENKEFGCRVFSYLNEEVLLPHYDSVTGKLSMFGRLYKRYDVDGESVMDEVLEVWTKTDVTTYVKSIGGSSSMRRISNNIRRFFTDECSIEGEPRLHGFPFLPVAYKRNEQGACWSPVQSCIDQYEKAVSQLCENNKISAFRILYLQGDDIDIQYDSTGTPTAIVGEKETDAKYLERADVSTAFETQLKILTQNIFQGTFTVLPPEVKGGDLAGVTIKLLYSPAIEKAITEAKEWDGFIDQTVKIFKTGCGIESKKSFNFESLDVKGEIKPYVHQNDMEIINNINSSVLAGSLSYETAGEIHPYRAINEVDRIQKEAREKVAAQVQEYDNESGMNDNNMAKQLIEN